MINKDEKYDLAPYVGRLYSAAVRKTGDAQAAEDIAQETFLAAASEFARGRYPDNLWSWLLRVMSNKYCDWLREKYGRPSVSFEDYSPEYPEPPDDRESRDAYAEKLEAVRRELGYLAKTHREVLVRFYLRTETVEKISSELNIPAGTVKSRLYNGRGDLRKGVLRMENYEKQSYEPDILRMSCSGGCGLDGEPFSLVGYDDKLTQNVLLLAYSKPVSETELSRALGVPAAFIEPVVERLIRGELMKRADGGRVYADFIIYTEDDRKKNLPKQLKTADESFELFWPSVDGGLSELRRREYYLRQGERAKAKLELHFCVKLLLNAVVSARDELTGVMPYSDYPYRKNGGRWFAMGQKYPPDYDFAKDTGYWKYEISGEAGTGIKNFRDAKYLELRKYDTNLGGFPNAYFKAEYIKWLYELLTKVPPEQSSAGESTLQSASAFIECGILTKSPELTLDIPVLSSAEYHDEALLQSKYSEIIHEAARAVLLTLFEEGRVKLPPHLDSVPKWQRYMYCGSALPMAVIYQAVGRGKFLSGADYQLPASILVLDR